METKDRNFMGSIETGLRNSLGFGMRHAGTKQNTKGKGEV